MINQESSIADSDAQAVLDHDESSAIPQMQKGNDANGRGEAPDAPHLADRDYLDVLRQMQEGQWDRVVPLLRALHERYPNVQELEQMMSEASFRASLETNWSDKVQTRQSTFVFPTRLVLPALGVLVLGAMLVWGVLYYSRIQRVNALTDQYQEMLQQAQASYVAGQYREALDIYDKVLAANPQHEDALKGQSETKRQLKLANDYQLALDRIAAGQFTPALELLLSLEEEAPGYRDVSKQIDELQNKVGAPQLYTDAESAYKREKWTTAIDLYQELRELDSKYEQETVQQHLAIAYFRAGQALTTIRPKDSGAPKQVESHFQKAIKLNIEDPTIEVEQSTLQTYLNGEQLLRQRGYEKSIELLRPLHEARPDYFGGYVGELLYQAYMGYAERKVDQGDLEEALALYRGAAALQVDNNGQVQERIEQLTTLLAPTPAPVVAAPSGSSAPANPVAAPPPPPNPVEQYRGWIAFRSNRDGGETVYIMKADGSEQQLAPLPLIQALPDMIQKQQWTADGIQFVYAEHVSDAASTNIFKARSDLPETWNREIMLTDYPGTEYDPVWSPDGQHIVFVSNHTGNDEIWIMDSEGANHRQLTQNSWEWDKRPSVSQDSQKIAFYSNRSGTRQIWLMNLDGSGAQNISKNQFEDWDPIWIR